MKANRTARSRCAVLLAAHAADQRLRLHSRPGAAADAARRERLRRSTSRLPRRAPNGRTTVGGCATATAQLAAADGGSACRLAGPGRPPRPGMRTAEGFAQRAGAALEAAGRRLRCGRHVQAQPERDHARRRRSQRLERQRQPSASSFSLDLDLWGKNRAAFRAANARRRCRRATNSTRRGWL